MATRRPARRRKRRHDSADFEQELIALARQGRFRDIVAACDKQRRHGPLSVSLSVSAMHVHGVALTQVERFDSAVATLQTAAERSEAAKNAAQALAIRNDLSKALFAAKRYGEAVAVLTRLRDQNPDEVTFARNLILVQEESGRLDAALKDCQAAVERWPDDVHLAFQLGELRMAAESWQEAVDAWLDVLKRDPDHQPARRKLVAAYRRLGDQAGVTGALRDWLQQDPGNPIARHLLSAQEFDVLDVKALPTRASDGYVRDVFDRFAETFDEQLQSLDYAAPRLLGSMMAELGLSADGNLSILDAGCGTGLMGERLRPFASRLVGVDLSSGMLQRAGERGYDALVCAELVSYLSAHPAEFELIVSMDTLIYFGDLAAVFLAANQALRGKRAPLVFTLEKGGVVDGATGYRLNPSGRYSHRVDYVRKTLERCGFSEIGVKESVLRKEAGEEVTGLCWTARKGEEG
ncbi:Mg-protoporphyrin IX methyl transferase [Stieleria neptunia]|uniref:Mg-protoporphyrin IX methyl transferase n=1 Tax=Stieleria neptunia TaxID=2527979 RepID=A0A518HPP1_9BACT|nr:tetratricopeptide repeat protein [Stieleria neptunia]QDV42747.1 Mg-protoporphyrin IX methyl transferase [Stieleria neptunia]